MSIYKFDKEDAYRFASEINATTRKRNKELQFKICPYCHAENDQWKFAINLDTGAYNCKRATCCAKGNMIHLARDFNFSLGRDIDEYYQPSRQYRNLKKYPVPESKPAAVEYLESRGISRAVTERYGITTYKDNDGILAFPFFDEGGMMQFVKYRNTHPKEGQNKEWCLKNCKPILFGMKQCDAEASKTLVLTEGQIDSLSCAEAGIQNAVSVPTGALGFTWVPYCWDFLGRFDTLIVFGDYEHGRITLLDEMRTRFHGVVKHVQPDDYLDCKDANELLMKYGRDAVVNAVANAVPIPNKRIKELIDVKRVDIASLEKISTGLKSLDGLIGGFYFGQLIILTGESGLGKSTLGSQFIVQAISERYPTFCYSGELADWMFTDWILRQIAGPEHLRIETAENGYRTYSVPNSRIPQIEVWLKEHDYWYDNSLLTETDDDTEEESLIQTVTTAIKQYGCRVIMLDNLMTAMEDEAAQDFYRQQTIFIKTLAKMAKQYNVIILLIAHPRKAGNNGFRNDDIAGSSNITNLADVVLRYAKPKEDEDNPPEYPRILQVTKNRLNGKTELKGIPLYFDEGSKRISETAEQFRWKYGWEPEERPFVVTDDWETADGDFDTEIPF